MGPSYGQTRDVVVLGIGLLTSQICAVLFYFLAGVNGSLLRYSFWLTTVFTIGAAISYGVTLPFHRGAAAALYSAGFSGRFALLLLYDWLMSASQATRLLLNTDVARFSQKGFALAADAGFLTGSVYIPSTDPGIWYLYGAIYEFAGGEAPIFVQTFHLAVASMLPVLILKLGDCLFDRQVALWGAILVVAYPGFFVLTAVPHKDILATALLVAGVLILTRSSFDERQNPKLGLLLGVWVLLLVLRAEIAFVFGAVSVCYLLFTRESFSPLGGRVVGRVLTVAGVVLVLAVVAWLYYQSASGFRLELATDPVLFVQTVREQRLMRLRDLGGAEGLAALPLRMSVVPGTILGVAVQFIKPFPPWNALRSLSLDSLLVPSSLMMPFVISFSVLGWKRSLADKSSSITLISWLVGLIILAAAVVFGGIQTRYRLMVLPFVLLFGAITIADGRRIRAGLMLGIAIFVSEYALYFLLD